MDTKEVIIKEGLVKEALMGGMFKVELEDGSEILASLSGKIRKNRIRVFAGDKVKLEFSPHDLNLGRITYRLK
jgi:translation initiation factor IF-1